MRLHVRVYVRLFEPCAALGLDHGEQRYMLPGPELRIALHASSPKTRPHECEIASFEVPAHRAELLAHHATTLFARAMEHASDEQRLATSLCTDARGDRARGAFSESEYYEMWKKLDCTLYAMWEIHARRTENERTTQLAHALFALSAVPAVPGIGVATTALSVARDAWERELAREVCAPGGELDAWGVALRNAANRACRETEELYRGDASLARTLRAKCGIALRSAKHWLAPSLKQVLQGWRL